MDKFIIDSKLVNDIGNYMARQPWVEVAQLLARLQAVAQSPYKEERAQKNNDGQLRDQAATS